jgi:hypothetical protein
MKESMRARVAAVVGAAFKGNPVSSVYDCSDGSHRKTTASIDNGQIYGYDYATSSRFLGFESSGNLNFYDYETLNHVRLKLDGSSFSGYDNHTGKHFSGTITGGAVSLYDYETARPYNFGV